MKRLIPRILLALAGALALVVGAFVVWVETRYDRSYDEIPYPDLKVSHDPAVIARGEYIVRGPAHCGLCHGGSLADAKRAEHGENPPLSGGWSIPIGPLGMVSSANLTPDPETGLGRYSDRAVFRMMRHNVRPNGQASIAPMMPFNTMSDDDLVAVVSYLRTLPPVHHVRPAAHWSFMGKVMRAFAPPPFAPVTGQTWPTKAPSQEATPERGQYLARSVANCWGCHSPLDHLTMQLKGPAYSGSIEAEPSVLDPSVSLRPPNLTPDPTGVLLEFQDEAPGWRASAQGGRSRPRTCPGGTSPG